MIAKNSYIYGKSVLSEWKYCMALILGIFWCAVLGKKSLVFQNFGRKSITIEYEILTTTSKINMYKLNLTNMVPDDPPFVMFRQLLSWFFVHKTQLRVFFLISPGLAICREQCLLINIVCLLTTPELNAYWEIWRTFCHGHTPTWELPGKARHHR